MQSNDTPALPHRKSADSPPLTPLESPLSGFSFDREMLGSLPAWEALREDHHRIGSQEAW
jgi:hypothetical protein